MSNELPEKRRFFRIDDTISLTYQLIDETMVSAGLRAMAHVYSEYALGATLDALSQESSRVMLLVEKQNDPLLELYKILDAKINAIAQTLILGNNKLVSHSCKEVNLSASGVAFQQENALDIGQHIAIEMYLPSTLAVILVYGKVIKCDQLEERQYAVSVDFVDIRPEDQELLIKHVVRKQWQQLQEKRALSETASEKP